MMLYFWFLTVLGGSLAAGSGMPSLTVRADGSFLRQQFMMPEQDLRYKY